MYKPSNDFINAVRTLAENKMLAEDVATSALIKVLNNELPSLLKEQNLPQLEVMEEVAGNFHYHLSETGCNLSKCLCGTKSVMRSNLDLAAWNRDPSHIRYAFCAECYDLARSHGYRLHRCSGSTITFKPTKR